MVDFLNNKATFTLAEAADLLSCHRETLRRAIRTGRLRAAKLGREFRISRPDLEAFWAASGGGGLFAASRQESADPTTDRQDTTAKNKEKKTGFEQLSLLSDISSS